MSIIARGARRIAGIDEKLLKECPRTDRIWANQLGFALSLTFMVIFGLVFYSLSYIGGAEVAYDTQLQSVKLDTNVQDYTSYLGFAVVSGVIAIIVFLFDRAFYQSDWFGLIPYGIKIGWAERSKRYLLKLFRMSIRIGISILLAYALSTFVELKFFESQLLSHMQKEHYKENKTLYDGLKKYTQDLEAELPIRQKEEARLLHKMQNLDDGIITYAEDTVLQGYQGEVASLASQLSKEAKAIKKDYSQKRSNIDKDMKGLQQKIESLRQQYNEAELLYDAEVNGVKEIVIGGKTIQASGKPKEGRRARMHKKHMRQIQREIRSVQKALMPLQNQLAKIEATYEKKLATIQSNNDRKSARIKSKIESHKTQLKENFQSHAKEIRAELERELKRVHLRLRQLVLHKDELISAAYQKMMQSPEFIRFRDGPMSRVMALKRLEKESEHGEEISIFAWGMRGLLIFLEIMPVFSKMWYSPNTLYPTLLQQRLKRMTRQAMDDEGMTLEDMDKAIAYEKKKQQVQEAKLHSWHKQVFNENYKKEMHDEMYHAMQKSDLYNNSRVKGEKTA